MKKTVCTLLSLALALCAFTGCEQKSSGSDSPAETSEESGSSAVIVKDDEVTPNDQSEFIYAESDGGIVIKGYKGSSLTVNIPAEIDGKPVVSIGEYAFDGYEKNDSGEQNAKAYKDNNINTITSVHIPSSVKTIEKGAFTNCYSLTDLTFAEGVETLEEGAFACCDKIAYVTLPSTVKKIGSYAFYECYSIREVKTGENIESIGEYAFYDCRTLRKIVIPDSVTELGKGAFAACVMLSNITVSKSLKVIPESCFCDCIAEEITIPEGITEIEGFAFERSTRLSKVNFPKSLLKIGEKAFFMCPEYTEAEIPENITEIGEKAFGYTVDASKAVADPEVFLKDDFTIKAKKGSAAEKYASENKIPVK